LKSIGSDRPLLMSAQQESAPAPGPNWYPGIDWLRAMFIAFIVCMHLNLAQQLSGQTVGITIADLVYSQIFCTAVPGFLFIAVFLQFLKKPDSKAVLSLFSGLFFLYVFWVSAWIMLTRARPEPSIVGVVCFILQGGGWAFYFFTLLILIHLQRFFIRKWSDCWLGVGLVVSLLTIAGCFWWMARNGHMWMRVPTYWWPISIIPIPFAAGLLARHYEQICRTSRHFLLVVTGCVLASAGAAVWEWSLAGPAGQVPMRPFLPEYLRVSPLLLVVAFVLVAMKLKSSPRVIRFLSRNSLGIFCLHVFVLRGLYSPVNRIAQNPAIASVVTLVVVLFVIGLFAELLRKIFKSRLV